MKNAWVTLVMLGDGYIPGALAMAASLRFQKTKYDIICMITNDVSEIAKIELEKVFDSVRLVEYMTFDNISLFLSCQLL